MGISREQFQSFYIMGMISILAFLLFFCLFGAEDDVIYAVVGDRTLAHDWKFTGDFTSKSLFVNATSKHYAVVAIASFGLLLALLITFNLAFILVCFHAYNHIRREECAKKSARMSDSTGVHETCCSCCV